MVEGEPAGRDAREETARHGRTAGGLRGARELWCVVQEDKRRLTERMRTKKMTSTTWRARR